MRKTPKRTTRKPPELANDARSKKERGLKEARQLARQISRDGIPMSHEEVVAAYCVPLSAEERDQREEYRRRLEGVLDHVSTYYADLKKLDAKQQAFIHAYAQTGIVREACLVARVSRRTVHEWIDNDANFREEFELAEEESTDVLEAHAVQRAKYMSDPLMVLMLKARRPEKYMDRSAVDLRKKEKTKRQTWQIGDLSLEF